MTHVFILVDSETMTMKQTNKRPEEVIQEIENGEFSLPQEMQYPRCMNLDDYVFVVGRKPLPEISEVQREIMEMLAMGASIKQIADVMKYSYEGIRYHVEKLKETFQVNTKNELAAIYIKNNPHMF